MKKYVKPIPVRLSGEGGSDISSRLTMREHVIIADEKAEMGGADQGPAPLEYFLSSLVSCSNAIMRRLADQAGIPIERTHFELETFLDPTGVWDTVPDWHPFPEITLRVRVQGPESEEQLRYLQSKVNSGCPVQVILRRSGTVIHEDWSLESG